MRAVSYIEIARGLGKSKDYFYALKHGNKERYRFLSSFDEDFETSLRIADEYVAHLLQEVGDAWLNQEGFRKKVAHLGVCGWDTTLFMVREHPAIDTKRGLIEKLEEAKKFIGVLE